MISTIIAIAILGFLASMTANLIIQQSSVSASSDMRYERDFMRRYIREGISCCDTLEPWLTSIDSFPCENINNDSANSLIHDSDRNKNSIHPRMLGGEIIAEVAEISGESAYTYGRWKFALRCNQQGSQKFLSLHSWRIGVDSRTGKDISLAEEYDVNASTYGGTISDGYYDIDAYRLCAGVFLNPGQCP